MTVKESRGRLSYLTPDRTKPITARKLGDDFDRAAVLTVLEQNAARAAEAPTTPRTIKDRLQAARAEIAAPKQDGVQRLVDIAAKRAEGKGKGYEHWAKIHNLKQAAKTLNVYQEYGFTSPEQLEAAVDTAYQEMRQTSGKLKTLETKLQGKKELQQQVLAYAKTKPACLHSTWTCGGAQRTGNGMYHVWLLLCLAAMTGNATVRGGGIGALYPHHQHMAHMVLDHKFLLLVGEGPRVHPGLGIGPAAVAGGEGSLLHARHHLVGRIEHQAGDLLHRHPGCQIPGPGVGVQPPVGIGQQLAAAGGVTEIQAVLLHHPVQSRGDAGPAGVFIGHIALLLLSALLHGKYLL